MRYIGTLSSDARGKLGGVVFTRGRNGTNMKAHAVPVNPRTPAQQGQRSAIAAAVNAWKALTSSNQTTWNALAPLYTYLNSLAQPYAPTGLQLWTQAYSNATWFGTAPPSNAPSAKPVFSSIDDAEVTNSGSSLVISAYALSLPYAGGWRVSSSFVLPPTVNYVKGIRRAPLGGSTSAYSVDVTHLWNLLYGALPPVGSNLAVRFNSFDPSSFISGTPFLSIAEVD